MRHVKQYEGWRLGSYVSTFMLKTCATTYEASLTIKDEDSILSK